MPLTDNIDPAIIVDDDVFMVEPALSAQTPLFSSMESSDTAASSAVSTPSLTSDKLTRPPPQLTPEDEAKVLSLFRGYTLSQRNKDVTSWVWKYGVDIQDVTTRR